MTRSQNIIHEGDLLSLLNRHLCSIQLRHTKHPHHQGRHNCHVFDFRQVNTILWGNWEPFSLRLPILHSVIIGLNLYYELGVQKNLPPRTMGDGKACVSEIQITCGGAG
jgi:hypothetical protein